MRFPMLSPIPRVLETVRAFAGLNEREPSGGRPAAAMNLSPEAYPALSPRGPMRKLRTLARPNGLFSGDVTAWVDGTSFVAEGVTRGTVTDGPKTMVGFGSSILIFPDKACYDSAAGTFRALERVNTPTGTVTVSLADADGVEYGAHASGPTAPANPANGALWLDTSGDTPVFRRFSAQQGVWAAVQPMYLRLAGSGIGTGLAKGDGVTLSGFTDPALNGTFVLSARASGAITIPAPCLRAQTASGITAARRVPDLDFVTVCGNRVWGCAGNTVYASRLGDPANWNVFSGIATDSYAAAVGTPGPFTGCFTLNGEVFFMKRDRAHLLSGSRPSNFTLTELTLPGLLPGCAPGQVGNTVYWPSPAGVMASRGGAPAAVDGDLLPFVPTAGKLAAWGTRLLYAAETAGGPRLLCLDPAHGWMDHTPLSAVALAPLKEDLLLLASDGALWSLSGRSYPALEASPAEEGPVAWRAESGDLWLKSPQAGAICFLQVAAELAPGSTLKVFLSVEGGPMEEKASLTSTVKRTFQVPVIPRRADHVRVRLSGTGPVKIFAVTVAAEKRRKWN